MAYAETPRDDPGVVGVPAGLPPIRTSLAWTRPQRPRAKFAPYVEPGPALDLRDMPGRVLMLAGLQASRDGHTLAWGGVDSLDRWHLEAQASGKVIALSFGPSNELAGSVGDVGRLARRYIEATHAYGAVRLDFWVQHGDAPETTTRRHLALELVTRAMPDLQIQFTFDDRPDVRVLEDAIVRKGVNVGIVNLVVRGARRAMRAVAEARDTLAKHLLAPRMGVTLRVDEEEDVRDVEALAAFARDADWIAFVGLMDPEGRHAEIFAM